MKNHFYLPVKKTLCPRNGLRSLCVSSFLVEQNEFFKVNCSVLLTQFVVLPQTPLGDILNQNLSVVYLICWCFQLRACVSFATKNRIIGNAAKSQVRLSMKLGHALIAKSFHLYPQRWLHKDSFCTGIPISDHNELQKYSPWLQKAPRTGIRRPVCPSRKTKTALQLA